MTQKERQSMVPAVVRRAVGYEMAGKESIPVSAVAAAVLDRARKELKIGQGKFRGSMMHALAWRGATDYTKVIAKALIGAVTTGPEEQPLFPGLEGMVWIGKVDGQQMLKRRDRLTDEEYQTMLRLLRRVSATLTKKIARYTVDYERAKPHWQDGMLFGEAYQLAAKQAS